MRSHVKKMFFKFTKSAAKRPLWIINIGRGRKHFSPGTGAFVCANHFVDGEPTTQNPCPTLFLTPTSYKYDGSPKKRKCQSETRSEAMTTPATSPSGSSEEEASGPDFEPLPDSPETMTERTPGIAQPDFTFENIATAGMVTFYTGLPDPETFKFLHDHLRPKAQIMNYWKGVSQVEKERPKEASSQWLAEMLKTAGPQLPPKKRGPHRKLDLEQELLLTLMRLRLGLLVDDLAFRFKVSRSLITQIFATWVRFLAKELSWLIMWPSKGQVQLELPDCFRRMYPKVRCIIDCTEVFTETPSALDVQAALWSTYKHHSTLKFDQVMADRGFKIKNELLMRQAYLCIPPSTKAGMQMVSKEVQETSRIANVRIYVEQAIGRLKRFRILKNELPINCLPLCDDLVTVVCALACLQDPLCAWRFRKNLQQHCFAKKWSGCSLMLEEIWCIIMVVRIMKQKPCPCLQSQDPGGMLGTSTPHHLQC